MKKRIFITGIGTDVGKTVVSAVVCQALGADYWKPIQAGDLDHGDRQSVTNWIDHPNCSIHPNQFALTQPMSPHAAAAIDNVHIDAADLIRPETDNTLVIEGAGGLLVPISDTQTIMDLLHPDDQVIVVSRHYLGSINHSLLTIKFLQQHHFNVSVIFNGNENAATESVIAGMTGVSVIGRIDDHVSMNAKIVRHYAQQFQEALQAL